MSALVTGGGGFVGRSVVEQLLARGEAVRVLARGEYPDLARAGAETVRGDVADPDAVLRACAGIDVVHHVAARAGVWGDPAEFRRTNVDGTRNVIDACRRAGVGRLVFTSSPSVVFGGRAHRGADESLPYPPRHESAYARTKAEAERLVIAASGPALRTVALRPHLVFGPRDPHLLPRVVARARAGRLVRVGDGANRVDLTWVEDAARAHLLAADALAHDWRVSGRAYFVTQGEPVHLWGFIDTVLTALGLPVPRRSVPLGAARAIGALLEGAHAALHLPGEPRLTRFVAAQLALDHWYDIGAARRDLGYAPRETISSALDRTLPWLRALP